MFMHVKEWDLEHFGETSGKGHVLSSHFYFETLTNNFFFFSVFCLEPQVQFTQQ